MPISYWPITPHLYIVNWGLEGYTCFFLISAQNIDCGYSLDLPRQGGSNEYTQFMFLSRNVKKISEVFILKV